MNFARGFFVLGAACALGASCAEQASATQTLRFQFQPTSAVQATLPLVRVGHPALSGQTVSAGSLRYWHNSAPVKIEVKSGAPLPRGVTLVVTLQGGERAGVAVGPRDATLTAWSGLGPGQGGLNLSYRFEGEGDARTLKDLDLTYTVLDF